MEEYFMGGKASGEGGEMKKPEKKDLIIKMGVSKKEAKEVHDKYCFTCGYNQACGEWEKYHKEQIDTYKEILEKYIPLDKLDEANNELLLLLGGNAEAIGRDLLKYKPKQSQKG